ncbi:MULTISPECIES: hypothetical protein [unclassified Pseudodesulfovibrio]|uniref:hypothetical protein n=1 Tax=unclassified Pseudodesulfovibrio TaxID=2661612 RepID=UPI000FEB81A8|nr:MULTISPECIES: hypothetical protein [unclassified Pseudodesulfovibrio]MCJ2163597.1 hypothetical protein [Pseudodesulfovibrio sp. S3-i]RWU06830.1 hypothetical protein DWB63_03445 [Pseudodesulfovibrio sp. S3]
MKIFVRERQRADEGTKKPRFKVVGVQGGDLKLYAKRIRKCELKEIAEITGAEVIYLARDGEGAEGKKK